MAEHHDECGCEDYVELVKKNYRFAALRILQRDIDEHAESDEVRRDALMYLAEALLDLAEHLPERLQKVR